MPTVIREINPKFLDYKIKKDAKGNDLVSVLYEVTRADTPMQDGDSYTWDSLVAAVNDPLTQQDILDGAMFGYDGHQETLYNKKKQPITTLPNTEKRLFRVDSLFLDYDEKRVLSWADYLPNTLGTEYSDKIRNDGFQPKVSMVSFVKCSKKVCNVRKIGSYDNVEDPNMLSAVMLAFNSSDAVKEKYLAQIEEELKLDSCCSNCASGEGECLSKHNHDHNHTNIKSNNSTSLLPDPKVENSRSGQIYFSKNSRLGEKKHMFISKYLTEVLRRDSTILSLDALYGMALSGWMTQQGIMSLAYWADCEKDSATKAKTMASSTNTEDTAESVAMSADSQTINKQLLEINKVYQANKKADSPSFLELLQKKEDSAKPKNDQLDQITQLAQQMSELTKAVSVLTTDSKKEEKKEDPKTEPTKPVNLKADIELHIDSILKEDTVTFQDGKLTYKKSSFEAADIKIIRDNAVKADSKENAVSILESSFAQLHKHKADGFLKSKGFDPNKDIDAKAKGATNMAATTGQSNEPLDLMRNSYMNIARVSNYDLYNRIKTNKDSAKYQEKVAPIKEMMNIQIDAQLKEVAEYCSTKGLRTDAFTGNDPNQVINNLLSWLPTETNKSDFRVKRDSMDQALINSTVRVILPTISSAVQMEAVEALDVLLDCYSGLGMESLDVAASAQVGGFGLVFNFEQDFAATATGNDDDPDNLLLADDGDSVFEEISSKNGRYEFISNQYGAVLRLSRTHMLNLFQQKIDLFARQQFRMIEKMQRDQTTRGLRELFRVAGDAGALAYSDTVANVAASGSQAEGGRYYTGEFARPTAGIAATLAGKTHGGTGSNIDMIIKLLGGQTSDTATQLVPVAKFRTKKSRDAKGQVTTQILNQMSVVIGSTDITADEGEIYKLANGATSIRQKKGGVASPKWALDEDGFVVLKTGAGQGANPTSAGAQIVIGYYAVTNLIRVNVDSSTNPVQTFWDDYLYACANTNSEMASAPNYAAGDMVLHSKVMATQIRQASLFRKDNSPIGANLLSIDNKFTGVYDDLTHIGTNATLPFGDTRSLILKQNYAKMNMHMEALSDWYRAQKADTSTGKIKTLDAVCADVVMQETFGIPTLTNPNTSKVSSFPMRQVWHYGKLKFRQ